MSHGLIAGSFLFFFFKKTSYSKLSPRDELAGCGFFYPEVSVELWSNGLRRRPGGMDLISVQIRVTAETREKGFVAAANITFCLHTHVGKFPTDLLINTSGS